MNNEIENCKLDRMLFYMDTLAIISTVTARLVRKTNLLQNVKNKITALAWHKCGEHPTNLEVFDHVFGMGLETSGQYRGGYLYIKSPELNTEEAVEAWLDRRYVHDHRLKRFMQWSGDHRGRAFI